MFKFVREEILPLFLERRESMRGLARAAGVSVETIARAVNGKPIQAAAVDKIARALGRDPITLLNFPD